jgi:hypothetical protein
MAVETLVTPLETVIVVMQISFLVPETQPARAAVAGCAEGTRERGE